MYRLWRKRGAPLGLQILYGLNHKPGDRTGFVVFPLLFVSIITLA